MTQQLPGGNSWLVREPYCYVRKNGTRIYVPPANLGTFEELYKTPLWSTDYGSIPKIFQNVFPKDGILAPIYVIHDWIYNSEMFSRDECDEILLEGAAELGYDLAERDVIWAAVRVGGGVTWDKHDPVYVTQMKAYYSTFMSEAPMRWPELFNN